MKSSYQIQWQRDVADMKRTAPNHTLFPHVVDVLLHRACAGPSYVIPRIYVSVSYSLYSRPTVVACEFSAVPGASVISSFEVHERSGRLTRAVQIHKIGNLECRNVGIT